MIFTTQVNSYIGTTIVVPDLPCMHNFEQQSRLESVHYTYMYDCTRVFFLNFNYISIAI